MNPDDTRELLANAARRSAHYLEGLEDRSVSPKPASVERLLAALDTPLADALTDAEEILSFIHQIQ